jgi:hypothetical protein
MIRYRVRRGVVIIMDVFTLKEAARVTKIGMETLRRAPEARRQAKAHDGE